MVGIFHNLKLKNFGFEKVTQKSAKSSGTSISTCLWNCNKILEKLGSKFNFLRNPKKCPFQLQSGKMVGVIKEMRLKVTSGGQNLQENVFG